MKAERAVWARTGAIVWVANAVQFLAVQLIVGAAWDTPYSWTANNISDLGNVHCGVWDESRPRYVCSPMHDAMNVSFALYGVLLLAGIVLTAAGGLWGAGRVSRAAQLLFVLNAGAWVVVGLAPADVDEDLHVLAAFVIMGLGNIGLALTACAPRGTPLGTLRPVSLAVAATGIVGAWLFFAQWDPGAWLGLGGLERLAAFAPGVWTLAAAGAALSGRVRSAVPA
ncbi:DUF998 domain-containing protein [Streptomyces sp. NPDC050658]|uniref:DUF998 domain-containing protein n=1 Tax=unclassified Streptomyces TaxID=2593676 RepID=UPI0034170486